MSIQELYQDFGLSTAPPTHHHSRNGWINIKCPYCSGNPGYHLGWHIHSKHFYCWRCGRKPMISTFATLLHLNFAETKKVLDQYDIDEYIVPNKKDSKKLPFLLPPGSDNLQPQHIRYLKKRKFNPKQIIKDFKILGTGPISRIEKVNYKHRIVIPYYWNSKIVSFDARDITEKAKDKYMACSRDREVIEHKKILYGMQEYWQETGIGVEGPTDVWRMGKEACATSGIQFTNAQVRLIAKYFKRFAVMFDDEPQAIKQAELLVSELKFRGVDSFRVPIVGDPGNLSQREANYLKKQILTNSKIYYYD